MTEEIRRKAEEAEETETSAQTDTAGETAAEETQETAVPEENSEEDVLEEDSGEAAAVEASAGEEETGAQEAAASGDGGDAGDGESARAGKKGSLFRRKKDKKDEKIEELTDRVQRQMAEFDNFRKRTEKEKSQMFDLGARSVIEKILPVIDNFERGLAQAGEDREDAFVQGMEMVYKQLLTELEAIGVKPIEAEGQEFDPNLHNAVMHCEDESAGENVVVQELQKGYTYHDTVVRHSMVKVAN